tara:strand:- start:107 stop:1108 length:1002 start_codon:yes stop_codon:yes gene_type:complete
VKPVFAEVALTRDAMDPAGIGSENEGYGIAKLEQLLREIESAAIIGTPRGWDWWQEVDQHLREVSERTDVSAFARERYDSVRQSLSELHLSIRPRADTRYSDGANEWGQCIADADRERSFSVAWGSHQEHKQYDRLRPIIDYASSDLSPGGGLITEPTDDPYRYAASFLSTTAILKIVDRYLLKRLFDEGKRSRYFTSLKSLEKHSKLTRNRAYPLQVIEFHHFHAANDDFIAWKPGGNRDRINQLLRQIFPDVNLTVNVWGKAEGREFDMHDRFILGDHLGLEMPGGLDIAGKERRMKAMTPKEVYDQTKILAQNSGWMKLLDEWKLEPSTY